LEILVASCELQPKHKPLQAENRDRKKNIKKKVKEREK
jgi:hypothetical protein